MTRENFISQVKAKMDELTPFNEGLVISDGMNTNPVFSHIDGLVNECVYEVIISSPVHIFPTKNAVTAVADVTISDNVGKVVLPTDFAKMASVEFTEWERPVLTVITDQDPKYLLQKNKYTRAGASKPVVVLRTIDDKRIIECYTLISAEGAKVKYVAKLTIEQMPEIILPALMWYVASKVYASMEDPKNSESAFKNYISSTTIRSL
jgi:hypothetical protein